VSTRRTIPNVRSGSWPCENFSSRAIRRNISEQLHLWESNHTAHARFDALLENCVFYISGMYEFLHSQGQILTPRSAPACLLPPNADIGRSSTRAEPTAERRRSAPRQAQGPDAAAPRTRPPARRCADPPRTCCDDDAKSAFASCGHAAALALGSNVPKAEVAVIRSLELIVQPDAKDVVGCCPRYRLTSDTGSLLEKPVRHSSKSVRAIRQPLFRDWPDAKVTSRVPQPRALKTPPVNSPVRS
jgi:hypothetical protein